VSKKLPFVTSDIPRDLRSFLDRLRELVAGSGADRLLSANDLAKSGLATVDSAGNIKAPPAVFLGTPPPPTNVTATAAIRNIIVTWDNPAYVGHAHAEVWGSSTTSQADSVLLGMTPGAIYVDEVGPSVTRYYWVRFVNTNDTPGPYNALVGTPATTGSDVGYFLDTLTEAALDPDSDYSKFAVRADFFSVMPSPDFNQEATPTATATGDLWYQPSTELVRTWTGSTWGSFSQTLPFVVNSSPQTINGVVVPAGVYMDAAFIKNGTITNAKIGNAAIDDAKIANLSAAKIDTGVLSADRIATGSLDAKIANISAAVITSGFINMARIQDAAITTAKIANAAITTAKIANATITEALIGNAQVGTLKIKGEAVSTTRYNVFDYSPPQMPSTLTTLSSYSATVANSGDYIIIVSISRIQNISGFVYGSSFITQEFELLVDGVRSVYAFNSFSDSAVPVNFGTRVQTLSAGAHSFVFKYRYTATNATLTGSGITQVRIYLFGAYR